MNVLLTGANGQVGWEVRRQAAELGIQVSGPGRGELDVADPEAVEKAIRHLEPAIVVNAAAYTAVDRAEEEAGLAYAANRDGPTHLAAACKKANIPLIHVSTDYVFDGEKGAPYTEEDPIGPLNVYGLSKLAGEEAVRTTLERHIIIRTSWVFGSHGNNFVKTVLRLADRGGPLRIVDDQFGAPTSARSIAECLLRLVRKYADEATLPWGTFHFTGTPQTTWFGFAREILAQANRLHLVDREVELLPISTTEFPTPAKRPRDTRLDTSRAAQQLACPPRDWQSDLTEVLTSSPIRRSD